MKAEPMLERTVSNAPAWWEEGYQPLLPEYDHNMKEEEPTMAPGLERETRWFDENVAPLSTGYQEILPDEDSDDLIDWFYEEKSPTRVSTVNRAHRPNVPIPDPVMIESPDEGSAKKASSELQQSMEREIKEEEDDSAPTSVIVVPAHYRSWNTVPATPKNANDRRLTTWATAGEPKAADYRNRHGNESLPWNTQTTQQIPQE